MGKVIMCTGVLSEEPFVVTGSERKLYSIEEICYYVANNIYGIELGFFDEILLEFIEKKLELPEVSSRLKTLLEKGHGLKDLVTTLLCSCDLYDRDEIVEVIDTLTRISKMENWEKRAHIGYKFLKEGNYLMALKYFRGILREEKISEKDYGRVLMAMGICMIYTSSYKEAADCFYKAYRHNRNRKILIFALLSLKLGGLEKEFKETAGEISETEPLLKEADEIWNKAYEEAKKGEAVKVLDSLFKISDEKEREAQVEKVFQKMKREYREGSRYGLISKKGEDIPSFK